jgi:hypothetical protein
MHEVPILSVEPQPNASETPRFRSLFVPLLDKARRLARRASAGQGVVRAAIDQ